MYGLISLYIKHFGEQCIEFQTMQTRFIPTFAFAVDFLKTFSIVYDINSRFLDMLQM